MDLKFTFSEVYHNNLNRYSPRKHDWKTVKAHCNVFIQNYYDYFPKIVSEIETATGHKWKQNDIKVYMVGWSGPSFSNPLTLCAKPDLLLMLTTLCHELLHIVFREEEPSLELEEKINNFVEKIFQKIDISAAKQINFMRDLSKHKYKDNKN